MARCWRQLCRLPAARAAGSRLQWSSINSALFPTPITDKGHRPGIPRLGLPLLSRRAPVSLWKSVSRKDHLDMHRRSQAAVNFHSPLPAAALAAPRCSCSDELCAWVCVFPPLPSPLPTPSLVLLTGSHTHPPNSTSEERVEKRRMKWSRLWEISPGLWEDMRRFRITSVSFHSPPKSVGAGGGIADGSSLHHVAEAAGIKLFTLPSC